MPCLLTLIALITPRILIVFLWLFTSWFIGIFPSAVWVLLGFIFLPTTLLWYSAVQHWFGGQWTFLPLLGVAIALAIDVSPASGRRRRD
jgi:hypothetical protein